MLKQMEGSQAIAEAVALCRPGVVSCYPITPQTHIVEGLAALVQAGKLPATRLLNVESEFASLSVMIGSATSGARSYTATSSQGLLFMAEAVYNASGLRLPIVMTIGNRAIGAPINIWNDHSDSMALRDAGWLQLYAESNQEALDLHIQAFRIAELVGVPVMVCVDGFILTHAIEQIDLPSQELVDRFLPPPRMRVRLDPARPVTIGAMAGPDSYTETRVLLHRAHQQAIEVISQVQAEFTSLFGRSSGGLLAGYHADDAETIVLALGSVNGTIQECVDVLRRRGQKIGSVKLCSYRPLPETALRTALRGARRVIVIEKNVQIGLGGALAREVQNALHGANVAVHSVIAGLGGRPITRVGVLNAIQEIETRKPSDTLFLDLNSDRVTVDELRDREFVQGLWHAAAEVRGTATV